MAPPASPAAAPARARSDGPADPAPAAPAAADWAQADGRWVLRVAGDWRAAAVAVPAAPAALAALPAPAATAPGAVAVQGAAAAAAVDGRGLSHWAPSLAAGLWQSLRPLAQRGLALDLQQLPGGLRDILLLALPAAAVPTAAAGGHRRRWAQPHWVTQVGLWAATAWADALATLRFIGEVLLSISRLLRGRADLRWADLAWQLDRTGPRSVGIVTLVCGLVGVILAYMGADQLRRFGAQTYIADLVSVGMVREIAALMTGVILAGRVGAAFAAQLASMQANDEIDALRSLGIDPVDHLVLPRLLALLLAAPLLTAMAALAGLLAGWAVAVAIFGVPPADFLTRSLHALSPTHVLIGLFKGTVYAMLVALAGCRQGLAAGRSAEAVGQATTAAVVQAIVWIVVVASVLTIVFQRLGW